MYMHPDLSELQPHMILYYETLILCSRCEIVVGNTVGNANLNEQYNGAYTAVQLKIQQLLWRPGA